MTTTSIQHIPTSQTEVDRFGADFYSALHPVGVDIPGTRKDQRSRDRQTGTAAHRTVARDLLRTLDAPGWRERIQTFKDRIDALVLSRKGRGHDCVALPHLVHAAVKESGEGLDALVSTLINHSDPAYAAKQATEAITALTKVVVVLELRAVHSFNARRRA